MGLIADEARTVDFIDALDDFAHGPAVRHRWVFALRALQIAGGEGLTLRTEAGELVCMAGLYPRGDHLEAWFAAGPALAGRFLEAFAALRQLFEQIAADVAPVAIVAYGAPGSVAAPTLARWFHMTAAGTTPSPVGELTVWTRSFA